MRRVYLEFKRHELPLSVLTLDADHMRGYRTMTLDGDRYPALKGFAELLAEEDVHLVASVNPAVKIEPGLELYEDGLARDVFCKAPDGEIVKGVVWPGWTAFPDFTSQPVRDWFGSNYHHPLQHGIDGFWHDMNEPQSFTAWGDPTIPLVAQHDLEGRGGDHREAHNVYGLLMNRAGYEGLRKLQPGRRPFILSRSGWVGMQRYGWTWTGDVQTSWAALKHTIPTVLNIGLCGMPYDGPDIGGFSGEPSPELFVRWFQLSTFLPFYRTHSAFYLPRREPWEWGERVLPILRDLLRLRYRLMPYWYTAAWKTSQTGEPIVRPLFWDHPQDPDYWEIEDTFLLGDSLLVAPVLTEGSRERTVRLPPGSWHDFWGDRVFPGSKQVTLDAPLSRIPVLVRGGSILPLEEGKRLELHVYAPVKDTHLPGSVWTGDLYSDAGDGCGAHRVDRFLLSSVEDGYQLDWQAEGEYTWPFAAVTLHLHGFGVDQVIVNGEGCPLQGDACEVPFLAQIRMICPS
jgi:alpha-glucosidase